MFIRVITFIITTMNTVCCGFCVTTLIRIIPGMNTSTTTIQYNTGLHS